jgi:hypothetical protein
MSSMEWVIAQGETGVIKTGRLSDATGYVDLSQYDEVYVVAKVSETSDPVIDAPVTVDPDQVANKGKFSYAFTADDAAIAKNAAGYLLNFRAMDGTTPTYYPLSKQLERTYGRLIVQAP